jgi:hypothetical protein
MQKQQGAVQSARWSSRPNSLPSLSYDVLFSVFRNFLSIDKQIFRDHIFDSLALVCTAWYEVSRRVRWERVDARSAEDLEALVKKIDRDATVGHMIRQLSLSFDCYRRSPGSPEDWLRWMELGERVLRAAPKLDMLDLVRFRPLFMEN